MLLCLTPDDFTRQRETPWAARGYLQSSFGVKDDFQVVTSYSNLTARPHGVAEIAGIFKFLEKHRFCGGLAWTVAGLTVEIKSCFQTSLSGRDRSADYRQRMVSWTNITLYWFCLLVLVLCECDSRWFDISWDVPKLGFQTDTESPHSRLKRYSHPACLVEKKWRLFQVYFVLRVEIILIVFIYNQSLLIYGSLVIFFNIFYLRKLLFWHSLHFWNTD